MGLYANGGGVGIDISVGKVFLLKNGAVVQIFDNKDAQITGKLGVKFAQKTGKHFTGYIHWQDIVNHIERDLGNATLETAYLLYGGKFG